MNELNNFDKAPRGHQCLTNFFVDTYYDEWLRKNLYLNLANLMAYLM